MYIQTLNLGDKSLLIANRLEVIAQARLLLFAIIVDVAAMERYSFERLATLTCPYRKDGSTTNALALVGQARDAVPYPLLTFQEVRSLTPHLHRGNATRPCTRLG